MSSENERFGDIMPVIIERIIRFERAETDAFIKQQNKRLAQLRAIERRKSNRIHFQKAGMWQADS